MLRWSKGNRQTRHLIGAGLVLGLVLAGCGPLTAQSQGAEAILLRGPDAVRGVPGYAPNRIPAFRGQYVLGEQVIEVLFTRESLYLPQAWSPRRCGTVRLYQVPAADGLVLCHAGERSERSERGFFLFFIFPESEPPDSWCSFIESFVERFVFLLGLSDSQTEVPFPAVLQLRR